LATNEIEYVSFEEAVRIHFGLMMRLGETQRGIESHDLIESALARPKHAANYENADIIRQAASLCFGLIKNHPWTGENKRTANFLMEEFLFRNGFELTATSKGLYEMSFTVELDAWKVDEIENWLRSRFKKI